ncbi:hypothetical protein J6TS2_37030 [Heyndrickxia sporothermodurans]|nr:hypothetical protein J6TS2_37030 [Heyndrickxia sporothermodurans]
MTINTLTSFKIAIKIRIFTAHKLKKSLEKKEIVMGDWYKKGINESNIMKKFLTTIP